MYRCFLLQCLSGVQDYIQMVGIRCPSSDFSLDSFRHRLTQGCAFWNKAVISFPASAGRGSVQNGRESFGRPTCIWSNQSNHLIPAVPGSMTFVDQDDEKTLQSYVESWKWLQSWSKRSQVIVSNCIGTCIQIKLPDHDLTDLNGRFWKSST